MINPYNTLGISTSSSFDTARKKYIELARKYHPDNFASSDKVSEDKMKIINNAFNLIKETFHHQIVQNFHKGKFTENEINQVIYRFNKGQSLNKIAREMLRSREAIRRHLIKLGYIAQTVKKDRVIKKTHWINYLVPSFHTILFIFISIAMILSFQYMGLMCFAFICILSD